MYLHNLAGPHGASVRVKAVLTKSKIQICKQTVQIYNCKDNKIKEVTDNRWLNEKILVCVLVIFLEPP